MTLQRIHYIAIAAAIFLFIAGTLHQQRHNLPSSLTSWTLKSNRPTWYDIASKHGTDKVSPHEYQWMYDKYLPALRDRPLKMLEIGLGCDMSYGPGKSYYTWLEYFPHVDLYYIEYDATCAKKWANQTSGATIFAGDQADVIFLEKFIRESGGEFDIIVDDGGHSMEQQMTSLEVLWEIVKPGGAYFIEDLQTSGWDGYGGGAAAAQAGKLTMMQYIYELLDDKMLMGKGHKVSSDLRSIDCMKEICGLWKMADDVTSLR